MKIFLDESGNLGKKDRFFVIAVLVPEKANRIKNIMKKFCVKLGVKETILDELKGHNLTFSEKQEILQNINAKDDFHCSYIVADKKHLLKKILEDKNICYNYLASLLFKPIIKGASEDIHIVLDNHSIKVGSINSLKDYIKIEAYTKWGFDKQITLEYMDSKMSKNLQAIDIIGNTIYGRYMYNKIHLYNLISNKFVHRIRFPQNKFNT